jgi:MFS superfamily sulfate permease-like transporter
MIIWEKPFIKNRVKFVPGALVAVIVSILINEVLKTMNSPLAIGTDHLVQIKAAGSAQEFFSFFTLPNFNGFLDGKIIMTVVMIAIIASLKPY